MSYRPDGYTDAGWHQDATADSGTDHMRYPRQYVIKCEWCDFIAFAPTAAEADQRFEAHREDWYNRYLDEGVAAGHFPDPRSNSNRRRA